MGTDLGTRRAGIAGAYLGTGSGFHWRRPLAGGAFPDEPSGGLFLRQAGEGEKRQLLGQGVARELWDNDKSGTPMQARQTLDG
eukprot:gene11214-21390_t